MPYRNIEDRREASRRHYNRNKAAYLDRNKEYRRHISEYVKSIKESSPCLDCGRFFPAYVMDFDHRGSNTKINIVSYLTTTGRIGALKKEIDKCDIVCSNCHRIRAHNRLVET